MPDPTQAPTPTATLEAAPIAETSSPLELAGDPEVGDDDAFSFVDREVASRTAAEAAPVPQPPAGGGEAPVQVVAPVAPVQAAPVPPVVTPPVSPTPAQPQAPAPVEQTLEQVDAQYKDWRTNQIKSLATQTFKLDDATIEQLNTNPAEVIPQLMANVLMNAVEATTVAISNMLPAAIERISGQRDSATKGENAFFERWSPLKAAYGNGNTEAAKKILEIGALWRHMNPRGTADQYIEAVGPMAMLSLGLGAPAPAPQPGPQVSAAPRALPHSPIAPSTVSAAPMVAQGSNRFADAFSGD